MISVTITITITSTITVTITLQFEHFSLLLPAMAYNPVLWGNDQSFGNPNMQPCMHASKQELTLALPSQYR